MYLDNNNKFYGEIEGKNIYSYLKFNFKLNTVEERIQYIDELFGLYEINGEKFYDEYWEEVFNQDRPHSKINLILDKSKSTYSTSNIAESLEKVADYILMVDDYKEEDERKYIIYNSKELFNRACQEYNVTSNLARVNGGLGMMGLTDEGKYEENAFPFFQLPKNYNLVKDIKLEKEDFERFPELKDYYDFYIYLKQEFKNLFNKKLSPKEMKRKKQLKNVLSELKKDMITAKKELQMPIIWKAPLKPTGCPDYNELDMFDKNVVKELLRVHKGIDLQDDLSCIIVDLNNLVKKVKFTDRQKDVLELWRKGLKTNDIAKELGIKQNSVSQALDRAVESIVKQYEKDYEDWYYLNIRKGQYKTCSKCKETKLASRFDKNGSRGLYSSCKKCRKK